jgi:hypothetical protein
VGHVALGLSSGEVHLYCRTKSEHVILLWQKVKKKYNWTVHKIVTVRHSAILFYIFIGQYESVSYIAF